MRIVRGVSRGALLVASLLVLVPCEEASTKEERLPSKERAKDASKETFLSNDDFERSLDDDHIFLSQADFVAAEKLANQTPITHSLSHQLFHRGDIKGKAAWRLKSKRVGARRNGVISGIKKWPSARIPYALSAKYNDRERAVLARSFSEYQKRTCVKFVPRTALDTDYLYIGKIDGCYSDVGRAGGRQELSLDDGCLQYDTAIHELMHSVGFYHEHERWDRDEHITILWHNIDRDAYDQFGKVDLSESSYYGQAYDYTSIMHYDSLAFSKNGFETMVAKRPEMTKVIGSAIDFSPTDLLKINLMYSCTEHLAKAGATLPSPPNVIGIPSALPSSNLSPLTLNSLTAPAAGIPSTVIDQSLGGPIIPHVVVPKEIPPAPFGVGSFVKPSEVVEEECRDRTNLCWRWLDRCRSFFFEKIMREFCAASCGYCTPGLPVPPKSSFVSRADPDEPVYRQVG